MASMSRGSRPPASVSLTLPAMPHMVGKTVSGLPAHRLDGIPVQLSCQEGIELLETVEISGDQLVVLDGDVERRLQEADDLEHARGVHDAALQEGRVLVQARIIAE